MGKTLFYRLFRSGALPPALRQELQSDPALFETEGVSVVIRRDGRAPGFRASPSYSWHSGAFAVTPRRILGTVRSRKLVDVPYELARAQGPVSIAVGADGLRVHFDMTAFAIPDVSGTMDIHFKGEVPAADLARLPVRSLSFTVPANGALALFRRRSS